MRAGSIVFLLTAAVLASLLAVAAGLLYRQPLRYADYEADRFGSPYYWIEHVTSTFAGQTDFWNVEVWNFAVDFILFLAIGCVALCVALAWELKRGSAR